jgi:hypothetical protein
MDGRLHRAWHSPRSGPVILLVAGLPVLILIGLLVAFPLVAAIEFVRALLSPGRVPFARTSALYIGFGLVGWAAVLLGAAQIWRIARANRGLDAQVTLGLPTGIRSPYRLAARLGRALAARGVDASEVIKEDYGAGLWIAAGGDRYWLAVSGEAGAEEAVVSLAYEPGIDLRRRLVRRADRDAFEVLLATLQAVIDADRALAPQGALQRP